MIDEVTKIFDNFIKQKFRNENIRNHLLNGERKQVCLDELCNQIKLCERQMFSIKFDAHKYRMVIKNVAMMYAEKALLKAEEAALSRLEKQRRIDESGRIQEAKEMLQETEREALSNKIVSYPGKVAE